MSLEQAIHERWAGDSQLTVLVPAERLFTGPVRSRPAFPYASIERKTTFASTYTSSGTRLRQIEIAMHVWSCTLDSGKAVADEIERLFDRSDFESDEGAVLNMRRHDRHEQVGHDRITQIGLKFVATVATNGN